VLSRSAAREDGKTRIAALATLIGVPAASAVLGLLALWLAAPVTALLFGARYLEAGRILAEAIWLLLPLSLAIGLQQIAFSHRGNLRLASLSTILGILAMAALYAPLTRAMAYHGALLATGIGMAIWAGGLVLTLGKAGILAKRPPAEAGIAPLS
jgi:O-antigen/teichoic acid export membrane protein